MVPPTEDAERALSGGVSDSAACLPPADTEEEGAAAHGEEKAPLLPPPAEACERAAAIRGPGRVRAGVVKAKGCTREPGPP